MCVWTVSVSLDSVLLITIVTFVHYSQSNTLGTGLEFVRRCVWL